MIKSVQNERYRSLNLQRFAGGANSDLVYFTDEKSVQILPSDVARILDFCRVFRTIDDHADEICAHFRIDSVRRETIKGLITNLASAGMLISQAALLKRCCQTSKFRLQPADAIASIAIVTRDRTNQLERALASYIENVQKYGRNCDFVILDDSPDPDRRGLHRQLLCQLKNEYDVTIRYAGLEEKVRFAHLLIAAGIPEEIIHFALFDTSESGCTMGANRNALLLDTAGDLVLSADDDTVCSIGHAIEPTVDLAFWSEVDPTEFWFFPDRKNALQSVSFTDLDLLAAHERVLGRELANIIADLPADAQVDFYQTCPHLFQSLLSGKGRIIVTFNGIVGDSGMSSPAGLLSAVQGDTRKRLVHAEANYRSALSSREVLRVARCLSVYHGTQCMSTVLGLDNRTLLPPFLPVQRNEDGLFGLTLNLCYEQSFFGHLPMTLVHAAEGRSCYPSDYMAFVSKLGLADLLLICMLTCQFMPGRSGERERLKVLGEYFVELGSAAVPEFEEFLQLQLCQKFSTRITALEKILKTYNEDPSFWARDLKLYIATVREGLAKGTYSLPADLSTGRSAGETRELISQFVLQFGQLLCWWADIVEVSKCLRSQGQRLAQPV